MLKKQKEQIVSSFKVSDEISDDINKDNLFIANKVISSRSAERNLFIGKQKDLVYKLADNAYLTLTDFNGLNEQFVVNRGLNKLFDKEQYRRYVETNGVMTFAGNVDLVEDQEDFIYLTSIQGLLGYGMNPYRMSYENIIDELKNVNKFLKKYYQTNLKNPSINPSCVKEDYVKANQYDFEHIVGALNDDIIGNELSLLYAIKKHKM